MTRLPIESHLAVDRPDLPEYELNRACPITGEVTGLENHHIWRRSAGYHSWYVELPDGDVVGNRINLSSQAHYRVTVNKARIAYENGVYYWEENGEKAPLRWQPPIWSPEIEDDLWGEPPTMHQRSRKDSPDQWVSGGHEKFETPIIPIRDEQHPVEPGHDCPTCRRRVPLPKKATSPTTKVFSCRVPIDDAETFSEIVDAAAEHAGLKAKPHHVYNTILVGVTLILQAAKEDLPS